MKRQLIKGNFYLVRKVIRQLGSFIGLFIEIEYVMNFAHEFRMRISLFLSLFLVSAMSLGASEVKLENYFVSYNKNEQRFEVYYDKSVKYIDKHIQICNQSRSFANDILIKYDLVNTKSYECKRAFKFQILDRLRQVKQGIRELVNERNEEFYFDAIMSDELSVSSVMPDWNEKDPEISMEKDLYKLHRYLLNHYALLKNLGIYAK